METGIHIRWLDPVGTGAVVETVALVVAAAPATAGVAVNSLFVEEFGIGVDSPVGLEVAAVPDSCCTSLWTENAGRGWSGTGLTTTLVLVEISKVDDEPRITLYDLIICGLLATWHLFNSDTR